jgi:hypothetical protein
MKAKVIYVIKGQIAFLAVSIHDASTEFAVSETLLTNY